MLSTTKGELLPVFPVLSERTNGDNSFSEDSEADNEDDDEVHRSSSIHYGQNAVMSDSEEDDEDDVLEIRSRRSRSSSSSRSDRPALTRTISPSASQPARRPTLTRQGSVDREHMTIAPIAPTMLKSTGVGNNLASISEDKSMRSQKEVELVYLPPSNSIYSLPGTPNIGAEDVYHHRESYFSVGTSSSAPASSTPFLGSRSADNSPLIPAVGLPSHSTRQTSHSGNLDSFFAGTVYASPVPHDADLQEDAFDYFGGPDLGEEYHQRAHSRSHRRSTSDRMDDPGGYEASARRFVYGGTSSAGHTPMSRSPRIVVNEVAGATEEREEMSTGSAELPVEVTMHHESQKKADVRVDDIPLAVSHIRNGPVVPVSVPRVAAHSPPGPHSPEGTTSFLSPTDAALVTAGGSGVGRGRSPGGGCSPTSGSTTTGSYSLSSGASDSRSESRGRSSTRNSSSECGRSGSRSSRGNNNSPLGSISPTGSALMIGGGYGSYRGSRDRDGRGAVLKSAMRRGSAEPADEERGRDRSGRRRIGDSLSPPSMIGSPSRTVSDDFPAYSPVVQKTVLPSPAPSVSGSSVSGSSTASVATVKPGDEDDRRGRSTAVAIQRSGIPPPIPEEEETRSRQPTPANSPVRPFSHHAHSSSTSSHHGPGVPLHVTPPKSRPSEPMTSPSEAQATAAVTRTVMRSPERGGLLGSASDVDDAHRLQQQHGLVGRAAEIVSQARGFLGSIWSSV
jgi:hypothetical protein